MTGAVLWDLDGTLVDSEEQHWRAWRDTMAAEGVPLNYEQFRSTFGQRNDSFVPEWLGPGATAERARRVADEKEACYRRLVLAHGLEPLPGAAEWVRRLREEGWKQAVASSAPALNVEAMLEASGLKPFFHATAAAEDVLVGKPDPEVFLVAAARVGARPRRCIVVEDAAAGLEAARRAGMRSIGVNRGAALDADIVVPSLAELPQDAFKRLLHAQKSDASRS
jgi:HAD superfamily hydrolase (TIGR01509 family)